MSRWVMVLHGIALYRILHTENGGWVGCWVSNRLIKSRSKILLWIELNFCGALAVNWQRTS